MYIRQYDRINIIISNNHLGHTSVEPRDLT